MSGTLAFRDWEDLHVPLTFSVGGRQYRVKPVSMETGFLLRLANSDDKQVSDDAADRLNQNWHERLLGADLLKQMEADGVTWTCMDRMAKAALADHLHGRLAALQVWDVAADPKAWAELLRLTRQILDSAA